MHQFTKEETMTILEAARVALSDADTFDMLAESLDLDDKVLCDLRDKLQMAMDTPTSVPIDLQTREGESLRPDCENGDSYTFNSQATSAWISAGNVSILISHDKNGVLVEVSPLGEEDPENLLDEMFVSFPRPTAECSKPYIACPTCGSNLEKPSSIVRTYINKDAGEDDGEESDAVGHGHYLPDGTFEPDLPADLSGGRYDLLDDSDRCSHCDQQI